MSEQIGEECGVGLILRLDTTQTESVTPFAVRLAKKQEPRGQCGYGIGGLHQEKFWTHKELVTATDSEVIDTIESYRYASAAIIHNRYATKKGRCHAALHPVEIADDDPLYHILFAFNGHIQDLDRALALLKKHRVVPKMKTDTFVIASLLHTLAKLRGNYTEALSEMAPCLDGAYNGVALTRSGTGIAFRDPLGMRPLFYGTAPKSRLSFVASEDSYARDAMKGDRLEISPLRAGQCLYLYPGQPDQEPELETFAIASSIDHCRQEAARCMFEPTYTENWESKFDDDSVARGRYRTGTTLAKADAPWIQELQISGEIEGFAVVLVPDTAKLAGRGYADESGIPSLELIQKKRVKGKNGERKKGKRTFIEPPSLRAKKAKEKYGYIKPPEGIKKCILVDDSIVRANTIPVIVKKLREMGFEEIHLRLAFPAVIGPCFYGIDMKELDELFARQFFKERQLDTEFLPPEILAKMAKKLGVDSLAFLSTKKAPKMLSDSPERVCNGCTRGNYPTTGGQELYDLKYEKFSRAEARKKT